VGGNGRQRTLPLAARYADIWNATFLAPDAFRERSARLDDLLRQAGRQPGDVRRTMMLSLFFGRDRAELDRRLRWRHEVPELAGKPLEAAVEAIRNRRNAIVGTPDLVVEQIRAYQAVGVEELMLQWFDMDDVDGLRAFAEHVLPQL
jgi:alkanesulfonate monooxygenase SsuD/methylene tetrahydromethanopterin reductase-like flavin-dependent oxidoreductase (luciferase family)